MNCVTVQASYFNNYIMMKLNAGEIYTVDNISDAYIIMLLRTALCMFGFNFLEFRRQHFLILLEDSCIIIIISKLNPFCGLKSPKTLCTATFSYDIRFKIRISLLHVIQTLQNRTVIL